MSDERKPIMTGLEFWQNLPSKIRELFPDRVRHVVIDISIDNGVRIFYETYGGDDKRSLIEAALRVGVMTEVGSGSDGSDGLFPAGLGGAE